MRISDWSSDVCSSDLICESARSGKRVDLIHLIDVAIAGDARRDRRCRAHPEALVDLDADMAGVGLGAQLEGLVEEDLSSEERSVGKDVSVRVDLGGRSSIKKTENKSHYAHLLTD